MPDYKNLFLRQSYLDAYGEYWESLSKPSYTCWDYVILTASNDSQAQAYRAQISYRLHAGKLPASAH